ncbi:MAG: hypothetical protein IPP30_10950 [Flavobacterium sp.]|nr:hypothetical protein [Flavobacterium sp.]
MAGINNGGGEYREYIWPVMALFGIGVIISLKNFYKTIAKRTTKEIYVSNWYIISAMMFLLVIAVIAYWPSWQKWIGRNYCSRLLYASGRWNVVYAFQSRIDVLFSPQQLNKPIYSYSLGFWRLGSNPFLYFNWNTSFHFSAILLVVANCCHCGSAV